MSKLEQSIKDRDLIDIGDMVNVAILNGEIFTGEVKCKPRDVGDCWIIVDDSGNIHYIQTFIEIVKLKKSIGPLPF